MFQALELGRTSQLSWSQDLETQEIHNILKKAVAENREPIYNLGERYSSSKYVMQITFYITGKQLLLA